MLGYKDIIEDSIVERLLRDREESIPIIIFGKDCKCDDLEEHVAKIGGKIKYKLPIINAVAAYMPSLGVRHMAMEGVTEKIYLDDEIFKLMDITSVTVGSDFANEYGLTGKDISVAVLDTGVFPHRDLTTPSNRIIKFKDFINNKNQPYDDDGHGTHVAGTIAGNGFASKGRYMGVAPDANIVGIKVLKGDGSGSVSDVIAGIQWAVDNKNKYNIKVLTLSLGTSPRNKYRDDPLCRAVDAAVNSGVTVVAAAGNSGPEASTITSPGISPKVITVGACDDRNGSMTQSIEFPDFSSRGPTKEGLNKPDVLAPGVNIQSLNNSQNEYVKLSGTSMANPVVAGCAALLYESNPEFTPSEIKNIITSNAYNLDLDINQQGAGLLDIKNIVEKSKPSPKSPINQPKSNNGYNKNKGLLSNEIFLIILVVIILLIL